MSLPASLTPSLSLPTSLPLHGFSPPFPRSRGTRFSVSVSVPSLPTLPHRPRHLLPAVSPFLMAHLQVAFTASPHDHPLASHLPL